MLRPHESKGRLIEALSGEAVDPPPIWLMRQAGRYLPEYREVRAKAGSFLDLCLNPALAAEVTLQPLRRFDLDAAIVFSDILIVPYALGQKVEFVEGEGPKLEPMRNGKDLARLDRTSAEKQFAPVYETLARVVPELPDGVPVIGFCGAPWTVATYMVEGGGSKDQAEARLWAYRDPASFQSLIDLLVETSIEYLLGQVKAGAARPPDFRQLGRRPAGRRVRPLVRIADSRHRGGGQGIGSRRTDHRISTGMRPIG